MRRAALLIAVAAAAIAADAPAPAPATAPAEAAKPAAYAFRAGDRRIYLYECTQEVDQETAGDKLASTTALAEKFLLETVAVAGQQATLRVTILHVTARHRGPDGERFVDSPAAADAEAVGGDDKLLGHLLALDGVVLTLTVDTASGAVSAVAGGDAIVAAIAKRAPSPFPDQPSPLEAGARRLYSSESLARWWSEALLAPGSGNQAVPPAPPLSLPLTRRWHGDGYDLTLADEAVGSPIQLLRDPTPLTARVAKLTGKGRSTVEDGYPGAAEGEATLVLQFEALTQPVSQTTHLAWRRVVLKK